MSHQPDGFDLHQVRFHVFHNSLSYIYREQIYDRGVDFCGRRKRPAILSIFRDNFRDLAGQFFLDPPVRFRGQLCTLGG